MQPEDRRRGKIQKGISRARILLKQHVGWLPGFPVAGESGALGWWRLPPEARSGEIISLDREQLRRMEMTLTKLRHRFPNALPKLVEDVDDWLGRMDLLLAMLKQAIHRQHGLEARSWLSEGVLPRQWTERFPELWNGQAPLRPLLAAAISLEMTGRSRPSADTMDWIAQHAPSLLKLSTLVPQGDGRRALEVQLFLYFLRGDMHPDFQSVLFECLADESTWLLPYEDVYRFARQLSVQVENAADRKPFELPVRPPHESIGEMFCRLLPDLLWLRPRSRRNVTELLSLLVTSHFIEKTRAWRKHVETEESRLLRMLRRLSAETSKQPRNKDERKRLKRFANVVVDDSSQRLMAHLRYAVSNAPAVGQSEALCGIWIRFLNHLPASNVDLRLGLFMRWEQMRSQHHQGERATRVFRHVLTPLSQLIGRRRVHPVLLSHWERYSQSQHYGDSEFVHDLVVGGIDDDTSARTIRLLEEVLYERGVTLHTELMCSLVEFVKATPDLRRAAALVATLAEHGDRGYEEDELRAALSVADDTAKAVEILRFLDDNLDLVGSVGLLGSKIRDDRLRRIVERTILDQDKKLLLRLAACTQLVVDLGFSVPGVPDTATSTAWVDRYPAPLQEALRQLSRVTEDAPTIATSLLSKDFPEEPKLRQEIVALRERLAQTDDDRSRHRLQTRLDNLEKRIGVSPAVTSQRLANLANRVWGRLDHHIVARYTRDCHDLAAEQLTSLYGADRLPEEFFQPPHDRLLSGILQLKRGTKELGLRLLLYRFGNTPRDFSSEPKNMAFRERLEAKGINMGPWLSDAFDHFATTHDGESYRLSFTRDVLDYLMMGFHFDTCLSPGSCNFFSTIANAIDINKQVVYGKTASGRVIGRCLFTLTDQGMILTYHRYAHDPSDGFSDAVDQFSKRLAQAMNTRLASAGKVSTLVAHDWYDDGAFGAESALDLQSADGVVRTLLRTGEPGAVIDELRQIMGTDEAVKSVLGSLLFVEEFTKRPAIVGPFVDAYGLGGGLTFQERIRLAILARGAGLGEAAHGILASLRPNSLPGRLKRHDCVACGAFHGIGDYREVLGLLIDYSPTLALRTIRGTRPRGGRRDADETQQDRRHALARIHQLLGRDHLATQLAGEDAQD